MYQDWKEKRKKRTEDCEKLGLWKPGEGTAASVTSRKLIVADKHFVSSSLMSRGKCEEVVKKRWDKSGNLDDKKNPRRILFCFEGGKSWLSQKLS